MGMNVVVPEASFNAAYRHRVRNFNDARRIQLENLPGSFDLSTLDQYEREIVEAFRQTDEYKSGVRIHQGEPHHHPV